MGLLDVDNEIHIYCLHYVYLPKINQRLNSFQEAWNRHPLQSEHSLSPEQMWTRGLAWFPAQSTVLSVSHGYVYFGLGGREIRVN